MSGLAPEEQRGAVGAFSTYMNKDDAEEKMNRLLAIPDHALRDALLERVMRDALTTKRRAAITSQLEKADLTPAQKTYLTSLFPPKPSYEETAAEPTTQ